MNIKNVLIFGAGACIGSLATYIIVKKQYEGMYEEYISEDVQEEYVEALDECAVTRERGLRTSVNPVSDRRDRIRYTDLTRNYKEDMMDLDTPEHNEDKDYQDGEILTREANNHNPNDSSYIISRDEFGEEKTHYDKLTIYFYEDNEVLTDENEEPVVDPTEIVGSDALESFGCLSGDPEIVYVRNDKREIDYEVIRLSKPYEGNHYE